MIEVKALVKNFGETRALDSLSFSVPSGVAYGLLGRNGAGKSTCIRIIMDIFKPDSGSALIDGKPLSKSGARIGYLPEERGLYPKRTIREQMIYIGRLRGLTKVDASRNMMKRLEDLEATEYLDRKLETLSKGNQQKIQLAIALISNPEIIILDEPFSGLDPVNAIRLKNIVRAEADAGKTVIFSSHQMATVEEFCDDICLIDKGHAVLEGNLKEIKRSYSRDTIIVETDDPDNAIKLAAEISQKLPGIVKSASAENGHIVIKLISADMRDSLYVSLPELGISPEKFYVKEPTLEDIFVEKVGGDVYEPDKEDKEFEAGKKNRKRFGKRAKKGDDKGKEVVE